MIASREGRPESVLICQTQSENVYPSPRIQALIYLPRVKRTKVKLRGLDNFPILIIAQILVFR